MINQPQDSGSDEIRRLMQDEVIARIPLLLKYTSSAGLRLQVPETDIQIIAGPQSWIASQIGDAATNSCAQRGDESENFGVSAGITPDYVAAQKDLNAAASNGLTYLASQSQAAQPSIKPWKKRLGGVNCYGRPYDRDIDAANEEIAELRANLAGQSQATRARCIDLMNDLMRFECVLTPEGKAEMYASETGPYVWLDHVLSTLAAPTVQEASQQAEQVPDLHNAIMNLPCNYKGDLNFEIAYKEGHRDARHAAAELVNEFEAAQEVTQQAHEAIKQKLRSAIKAAFIEGFKESGAGWNYETLCDPESDPHFVARLNGYLASTGSTSSALVAMEVTQQAAPEYLHEALALCDGLIHTDGSNARSLACELRPKIEATMLTQQAAKAETAEQAEGDQANVLPPEARK